MDNNEDINLDGQEEVKEVPYNQDPKIQKYLDRQLSKRTAELSRQIEELRASRTAQPSSPTDEDNDVYEVWKKFVGDDTDAKKDFLKQLKDADERRFTRAEERAYQRIVAEREAENRLEKETTRHLETSIEDIEDEYNVDLTSSDPVARKQKKDFLDFVESIAPRDNEGNIIALPNMKNAFKVLS